MPIRFPMLAVLATVYISFDIDSHSRPQVLYAYGIDRSYSSRVSKLIGIVL